MDEDCETCSEWSQDEIVISKVLNSTTTEEGDLMYECLTDDGPEWFDRSDLMDDGYKQRMVVAYDRRFPPQWDLECTHCEGEGCEECICSECERPCRHINGINYGCELHPVI